MFQPTVFGETSDRGLDDKLYVCLHPYLLVGHEECEFERLERRASLER